MNAQKLEDFVRENYASKADFARAVGKLPQAVSPWFRNGWIVVDGVIYSPRVAIDKSEKVETHVCNGHN